MHGTKTEFSRIIVCDKQCYRSIIYTYIHVYRIAGIFRGYKFSRMDHYKGFRGFYFRGLSSSLLAHAHINIMQCTSTPLASNPGLAYNGEAPLIVDRCGQ